MPQAPPARADARAFLCLDVLCLPTSIGRALAGHRPYPYGGKGLTMLVTQPVCHNAFAGGLKQSSCGVADRPRLIRAQPIADAAECGDRSLLWACFETLRWPSRRSGA